MAELGVPLLDVPLRLARGAKQMIGGAPMEALQNPEPYEQANRAGDLSQRYAKEINAIRQAAASGAPEAVPVAWQMLGAFRNRALADRVRGDDFDAVFEPLRKEVSTLTRSTIGLDPQSLGRQALMEGGDAGKLAVPMSRAIANQASAGLSGARQRAVEAKLPAELASEQALSNQRNAGAYANRQQGELYGAQREQVVPTQADANRALAEKRRRVDPTGGQMGGAGVRDMGVNDYTAAYNAIEQAAMNGRPADEIQGRVLALNDMARQLNQSGYDFPQVELGTETSPSGKARPVLRPMAGSTAPPAQRAQQWAAEDQRAAPAAAGPPPMAPQAPGAPPLQQQAPLPEAEAPPMSAPADVGDLSNLLGGLAQEAQRRAVTRSEVRRVLIQRGIEPGSQQEQAIWQQLTGAGGAVR